MSPHQHEIDTLLPECNAAERAQRNALASLAAVVSRKKKTEQVQFALLRDLVNMKKVGG